MVNDRGNHARTAKDMYGARGWVTHHNTDLWRATAPIDSPARGMWPTGGAWLCRHLWDRYEYSGDKNYLAKVYPVLKVRRNSSSIRWRKSQSTSGSSRILRFRRRTSIRLVHPVCAGPTMDSQIIRDLFANCIRASEILGTDGSSGNNLKPPAPCARADSVGKAGQVQEWLEDWDTRRRIRSTATSRICMDFIRANKSPCAAHRNSPQRRRSSTRGDITTGWAIAWRINCWAAARMAIAR